MTTATLDDTVAVDDGQPERPRAVWRAFGGLVSAAAAVAGGHLVASLINPAASPLVVIGSTLIDAAPTPAKEFAVRTLGTFDKPVLIGTVLLVLMMVAGFLGLIAWRHRTLALTGIAALGTAALVAAVVRGPLTDAVPSLAGIVLGTAALGWLTKIKATVPGLPAQASRRRFLVGAGSLGVVAALAGVGGELVNRARQAGSAAARMIGLPLPRSAAPAVPAAAQVPGMTPFITSNADFYRVDISLVTPRVDVATWSLAIDGLVDRPFRLSFKDLLELPMIERDITLTCVSNEVGGPYVGSARWLGVPFSEIIKLVGVQSGVEQVYSYSSDSGYTCSTPYQAVSDGRDAMIAVGMNGELLPDKHGFPARMLVPGLFGFVSATKWLQRIEFGTYREHEAYWTKRGWATDAPILTQSRIDIPRSLGSLPKRKPVIAGVAWAQHRGISKVEIRIDGGPWRETKLADDAGIDLWRQWTYVFDGPAGRHSAQVRATDKTGQTQPEKRTKVFPSGATGWHEISFQSE